MNNLCVCLHFYKRKVLLKMLLQVYIKDSNMFSAHTPGLRKKKRTSTLKMTSMKMIFSIKSDLLNKNSQKVANPF